MSASVKGKQKSRFNPEGGGGGTPHNKGVGMVIRNF